MNLHCKVAEDLLPLYHDGVCSEESKALVEEHLDQCEKCRETYAAIQKELIPPPVPGDALKPLKTIRRKMNKRLKKALIVGVAITMVVVAMLFGGHAVWWYQQHYSFYQQFAEGHDPNMMYACDEEGNVITSIEPILIDEHQFSWGTSEYYYRVIVPGYPSTYGHISMDCVSNTENEDIGLGISQAEDGGFLYHVSIRIESEKVYVYLMLDEAMNQVYLSHWDEDQIVQQDKALQDHYDTVMELIQAAQEMWPFLKEV